MFQVLCISVFMVHLCSSEQVTQYDPQTLEEELSSLKESMEKFMSRWSGFSFIENYNDILENKNNAKPVRREVKDEDADDDDVGKVEEKEITTTAKDIDAPVDSQEENVALLDEAEDSSAEYTSDEAVYDAVEDDTDPAVVSFGGPVKAQGKVSIAAHFGGGENGAGYSVSSEIPTSKNGDETPEGPVIFEGPVHAQGKVSVGAHYGCGGPIGTPPVFFPQPWMYMPPIMPELFIVHPYPVADSLFMPEYVTGKKSDHKQAHLPVASIMAKHYYDAENWSGEDEYEHVVFNGFVPSGGTVSIAAIF